jgi:hypothetical protein
LCFTAAAPEEGLLDFFILLSPLPELLYLEIDLLISLSVATTLRRMSSIKIVVVDFSTLRCGIMISFVAALDVLSNRLMNSFNDESDVDSVSESHSRLSIASKERSSGIDASIIWWA